MAVLVTGGAGFIGSHMVAELIENKMDPVVLDNLSTGNKKAVTGGRLYLGDIRNPGDLDKVFSENDIESVVHFAASSIVPESMADPAKYYDNNINGTLCLLKAMERHKVGRLVFSSTAAVYGETERIPITEDCPANPKSPYGETKLAMERMIEWFSRAGTLKYVSLRYFNACGAHPSGEIGEWRPFETHLIPIILQYLLGMRDRLYVYGTDYDTKDGTCIRDYIHVSDLVRAHTAALKYLEGGNKPEIFNLGMGRGFSVLEIIKAAGEATGMPVRYETAKRRTGDPAVLIASNEKAAKILGWKTDINDPVKIISDAWNFYIRNPKGYN
ncbi:MAG: UDP-glucose 4-epimerase GalE [Clostridia bacterium]|nr:UDP-glucose 4-epimerase GalE [Clostridia bacterium]